jgi:hypothetical protein
MNGSLSGQSGRIYINDWISDYNQDAEIFTCVTSSSPQGVKTLLAGTYHFSWTIYMEGYDNNSGYEQQHLCTGANTTVDVSYHITQVPANADGEWTKFQHSTTLIVSANDVWGISPNRSTGTYVVSGGTATTIVATYLGAAS